MTINDNHMTITTIDMHTAGEPLRIITGGIPEIPGQTVLERRRYFRDTLDHIRTGLMWEPRGHADMYGVVLTPPNDPGADFGAFFLHNEGYSTMCGHAVLALAKFAVDHGLVEKNEGNTEMVIDVPAGRLKAVAHVKDGKVIGSSFRNVPSFIYLKDGEVDVKGHGKVNFDIAFGGAFYSFVKAVDFKLQMVPANATKFIDLGRTIKKAVREKYPVRHPYEEDLNFLYGTIFYGEPEDPGHFSRNVCIFADGELDRSPTGSGVSARAALHFFSGDLKVGDKVTIESIIGTTMDVKIIDIVDFAGYRSVIPEVSGQAYYTGEHKFVFEEDDKLRNGFLVR